MAEEPRSTPPRVDSTPPAARAAPPYPFWMLFGLGALCCAAWLGAVLLDSAALGTPTLVALAAPLTHMPAWLLSALHVMLMLAVPTLILCMLRSPRLPARRHARTFYLVEALVMVLVALPALTASSDLTSPLRLPTLSLGVALAAVDPRVSEWWRARRDHGAEQWWEPKGPNASTALVAGAGFCAVLLAAAFMELSMGQCTSHIFFGCNKLPVFLVIEAFTFVCVFTFAVMCGAWLGYLLGASIAYSDRWRGELAG